MHFNQQENMFCLQILRSVDFDGKFSVCNMLIVKLHKIRPKISLFIFGTNFLGCCNLAAVGV